MSVPDTAVPRPLPDQRVVRHHRARLRAAVGVGGRRARHGGRARRRAGHRHRRQRVARRPDHRRRQLLGGQRRARRARSSTRCARSPTVTVHRVSDRTFLLHLGGKISVQSEGAAAHPRRPVDGLHARASAGCRWRWPQHPEDVAKLTVKGNAVAVVTDGSAVLGLGNIGPGRRAAGDGGQGGAVQALRRHRRVADLPRHPGHRRDRAGRAGDLARLRRHQPRGHLGAALLRDRTAAARRARHPGLPRRPARHRDRRDGRADQRAALRGRSRSPTARIVVAGGGAAGTAIVALLLAAGARHVLVWDREGILAPADTRLNEAKRDAGRADQSRPASPATCTTRCAAPTCSSGSARPTCCRPAWISDMAPAPGGLRAGQPRPRGRRRRRPAPGRGAGHRAQRLPEPDQQRAGLPRRVPRPARRAGPRGDDADAALGRRRARALRVATSSSTRPTSCRRCSTRPCPPRSPPPCAPRPSRARLTDPVDPLVNDEWVEPERVPISSFLAPDPEGRPPCASRSRSSLAAVFAMVALGACSNSLGARDHASAGGGVARQRRRRR